MASRFHPLRASARATLWAAGAALGLGLVAGATLDGTAGSLALAALAAFVGCALYAVLGMSRYAVAAVASAGTALALGSSLAFLRLLGLAWDQDPDAVTTVSSRDADPYFFGALAAAAVTLAVLFGGAVWPERRRAPLKRRPAAGAAPRRPQRASSPAPRRPAPAVGRPAAPRPAAARPAAPAARPRVSDSSSRGARRS